MRVIRQQIELLLGQVESETSVGTLESSTMIRSTTPIVPNVDVVAALKQV